MKKYLILAIAVITVFAGCTQQTEPKAYETSVYKMSGPSMIPTLNENDILTVKRTEDYNREDIIIYRLPHDSSQRHVKRIIGLPGETIKIQDGNVTIVNSENPDGILLDETYLDTEIKGRTLAKNDLNKFELPADGYFVLGDNRIYSTDSRHCFRDAYEGGCNDEYSQFHITKDNIIGKIVDVKKVKSESNLTFEHDHFSLTFPAEFEQDHPGNILPKEPNAFPRMRFTVYDAMQTPTPTFAEFLDLEKQDHENRCKHMLGCPEIIENKEVTFDDVPGMLMITNVKHGEYYGEGIPYTVDYLYLLVQENPSTQGYTRFKLTFSEEGTREKSDEFLAEIDAIMQTIEIE